MKGKVVIFVLVILTVAIYFYWNNPDVKGVYIAKENPDHKIVLNGIGDYSGKYQYKIKDAIVNKGTWEYIDDSWNKIRFNNWMDQGLYNNEIDTVPTTCFVILKGNKLEFHPDLYEDDFIKE